MPQSHISKIEAGQVNLQLSSLTEDSPACWSSRLRLVPRKAVPAGDSIVRTVAPSTNRAAQARPADSLRRLAERLPEIDSGAHIMKHNRLGDAIHFLQHVAIPAAELAATQRALDILLKLEQNPISPDRSRRR